MKATDRFAHAYHSLERVEWVRALPCVVCGASPCDNAHLSRKGGGVGLKGHYTQTAPLCRRHHVEQGQIGAQSFAKKHDLDYAALAEETQRSWEAHLNGGEE